MTKSPRRIPLVTLLLAACTAAILLIAPAAQARVSRDFVGVSSEDVFSGSPSYRSAQLSAQATVHIGLHRQTFLWKDIETSPGVFNFSTYDSYVLAAANHGIKILPILQTAPSFRARPPSGTTIFPPNSNADYARFVAQVVRRYGPTGTLWNAFPGLRRYAIRDIQIWNEPSLRQYWGGRPNARQYVRMLKAARRAARSVSRRVRIVTAGIPPSTQAGAVRIERYIRQMYRAGGRRAFDVLAINSYAKNQRELVRLLKKVRRLMRRGRDRRHKIWITEIGWGDTGPRHRFIVGASRQARLITSSVRAIKRYRRRLRLRGFVYFSWKDARPYSGKDLWGLHTGLLRLDGSRKPAYGAFARATGRL